VRKLLLPLLCLALAAGLEAAKIKVQAAGDPNFDFAAVKTWAWDADAGEVVMARTPKDDPAPVKAFADPRIRKYVGEALTKIGRVEQTNGMPDVQLHYYVLVTIQSNSQYMGQFLPSTTYWGMPPFDAGTSSLEVLTKGALVVDALLPGDKDKRSVVWRGIAQSTLEWAEKEDVRDKRLREAANELIKKFPLKKKNK
jgi:hypothetical protein